MIAAIHLSAWDVGLAGFLLCIGAGVSLAAGLGLERRLGMAALRSVVQLLALGAVLAWVFARESPWVVATWMLGMAVLAGVESVRRTSLRVRGLYPAATAILVCTSMLVTLYGLRLIIRAEPWWSPRYAIPVLGMVLGNTLTGISVGLQSVLGAFRQRQSEIELLLAAGHSPQHAAAGPVRDALRTGMLPILNTMSVVGLISIPGMMTGQILGGEDPAQAARYQMFILFLIAGNVSLGTMGVVLAARQLMFDGRGRLRVDRLRTSKLAQ